MRLSPRAERLRSDFLNWTLRTNNQGIKRDYRLYNQFFTTLPEPARFWELLASSRLAGQWGPHYKFMGAAKLLLLAGDPHPVRELYPELSCGGPPSQLRPGELFQEFCEQNWEHIIEIGCRRDVQINKVGRCALFVPLFAKAFQLGGCRPLGIVEVGSSGGFGLLWSHLNYDYGRRGQVGGNPEALTLSCRVFGGKAFAIPNMLPPAASQVGLERDILDLNQEDDALWLMSLVAPNNLLGQAQVRAATALSRRLNIEIRSGCVLKTLEPAFTEIPPGATCLVFHSLTTHHLHADGKLAQYEDLLRRLSYKRPFFQATLEWGSYPEDYGKSIPLRLVKWENGRLTSAAYGVTDPAADGRWIHSA